MNLTRRLILSTSLLGLIAAGAEAAKLKVPKHYPTIQAAVLAASAGDEIEVHSGVYQELVTIYSGRPGLTLRAEGKVILDVWGPGGSSGPYPPAIRVDSANVTLQGFMIRNSKGYAVEVFAPGVTLKQMKFRSTDGGVRDNGNQGLRVIKCTFFNCDDAGVQSTGDNLLVSGCSFRNAEGESIESWGNHVTVIKSSFLSNYHYSAIRLDGADLRVEHNDIRNTDEGMDINGGGGEIIIRSNRITNTDSNGIEISLSVPSDRILIQNNRIVNTGSRGLDLDGCAGATIRKNYLENTDGLYIEDSDSVTTEKNRIANSEHSGITLRRCSELVIRDNELHGGGIYVSGGTTNTSYGIVIDQNQISEVDNEDEGIRVLSADQISITDNDIRGVSDAGGIYISGSVITSCHVAGNRVRQAGDAGIEFRATTSTNVFIEENEVRQCGGESYDCGFDLSGPGLVVRNNKSFANAGDGYFLYGDSMMVSQNVAIGNAVDGIDLEGHQVTVENNTCRDNNAEGIEVNGDQNTIRKNTVRQNRIDLANDGTGNTFTGNNYQTGGSTTAPEID